MARPTEFEQRQRVREFWRLLTVTGSVSEAVRRSRIDPERALRLLDCREGLTAVLELVGEEVAA